MYIWNFSWRNKIDIFIRLSTSKCQITSNAGSSPCYNEFVYTQRGKAWVCLRHRAQPLEYKMADVVKTFRSGYPFLWVGRCREIWIQAQEKLSRFMSVALPELQAVEKPVGKFVVFSQLPKKNIYPAGVFEIFMIMWFHLVDHPVKVRCCKIRVSPPACLYHVICWCHCHFCETKTQASVPLYHALGSTVRNWFNSTSTWSVVLENYKYKFNSCYCPRGERLDCPGFALLVSFNLLANENLNNWRNILNSNIHTSTITRLSPLSMLSM